MAGQYFNIPLANKAGLVEMQAYLKTQLPAGAELVDPATLHITLVYAEDAAGADLSAITWPGSIPVFGVTGSWVSLWPTQDQRIAVVMPVQAGPQLRAIQTVLFYEAWSRGATISPFSFPGAWRPHVTLAYLPAEAVDTEQYIEMIGAFAAQVTHVALTGDGYSELARFDLATRGPGGQVLEMGTMNADERKQMVREAMRRPDGRFAIRDVIAVTEFRGIEGVDYPAVPTSEAVDLKALAEGDEKPFFVTLKIGQANVTSGNGVYYDAAFAREMVRQTTAKRPTGGPGHIKDQDLGSAMPLNDMTWIGAVLQQEFVWGKAYVAPGSVRDYLRRRGAANAEVATSIFGYAEELVWNEQQGAWQIALHAPDADGNTGFVLEYIDLATPERAGVPSLATVPLITSEMAGAARGDAPAADTERGDEMDKLDVLKALTAEDIQHLPQAVIADIQQQSAAVKLVGELRGVLGLDANGDVVAAVRELAEQRVKTAELAVKARIKELIEDKEHGVKLEHLRPIITELVQAEKPQTAKDAEAVFEQVMQRASVSELLKAGLQATMGSAQRRPVGQAGGANGASAYVDIPSDNEA